MMLSFCYCLMSDGVQYGRLVNGDAQLTNRTLPETGERNPPTANFAGAAGS
jgi:hypothetical protein